MEIRMYKRSNTACAWVEEGADARSESKLSPHHGRDQPAESSGRVLWASKPWMSPKGKCVAIRLAATGNRVLAGIAKGEGRREIDWVPAEKVLSARDADRWARSGFDQL